jgi:hypothetical protein
MHAVSANCTATVMTSCSSRKLVHVGLHAGYVGLWFILFSDFICWSYLAPILLSFQCSVAKLILSIRSCSSVGVATSSKYSAIHTALLDSACYWPCRNPCLFDVELATQSLSLFLTNQVNRNLGHLKRLWNCTHFSAYTLITHSAWLRWLRPRYRHTIVKLSSKKLCSTSARCKVRPRVQILIIPP